jgi:hypothetical protein
MSDHLHAVLRNPVREVLPDDEAYDSAFDRFEYIVALTRGGVRDDAGHGRSSAGPIGRFGWRSERMSGPTILQRMDEDIAREGGQWFLLKRGVYGGLTDSLKQAKREMDEHIRSRR